jgi:YtcA family
MIMRRRVLWLVPAVSVLNGCAHAPAVDILGSFFPIWIFCIVIGIAATAIAYQISVRFGGDVDYGPPVLIYPSLVILFSCLVWLIFFR